MKSLYLEQLGVNEDDILNNYVTLLRHAIGDKRLFVRAKKQLPKPPELKELWRKELRTCLRCEIVKFYPYYYAQKYCGSEKAKEGCAWIRRQEGLKKSLEIRIKNRIKRGYGI